MAISALVSPEEYLSTSFEGPDREYKDGVIIERPMGNVTHSRIQRVIVNRVHLGTPPSRLFAFPELRLRVAERLYRVSDVSVFADREPEEEVPRDPPLLVVEIISPDDRFPELMERLSDLQSWGVPNIWVIDGPHKQLYVYRDGSLVRVPALSLPGYALQLAPADLWPSA